jgi:hypothetical protein
MSTAAAFLLYRRLYNPSKDESIGIVASYINLKISCRIHTVGALEMKSEK